MGRASPPSGSACCYGAPRWGAGEERARKGGREEEGGKEMGEWDVMRCKGKNKRKEG